MDLTDNPGKCEVAPPPEAMSAEDQKKTEEKSRNRRYLGILLALIAALKFSLSALIIKVLKYHPCNFGVWRFTSMLVITTPFLIHGQFFRKVKNASEDSSENEGILKQVWPPNKTCALLVLQGILGCNSILFVFFGLSYLNIGDSIVIGTSAPVFVSIVAWIVLKEPLGIVPMITTVVAMLGVVIICKPPILTGQTVFSGDTVKGVAFSFASMVLLTACYVLIRYLRKVHHALVQFCFAFWGLFESLILATALGVLQLPQNWMEAGLIVVNAGFAFTAQTCITLALKYENAAIVSLVRTTEVVFCYLWQAFFLHAQPDLFSVIGAVTTLSCVMIIGLRNTVKGLPDDNKQKRIFGWLLR